MEDSMMRMTVDEMRSSYPNCCIGIADVEFDNRNQVIAGDVRYADRSEEEIIRMAIQRTGIMPFYTSTSETLTMGALMV